MILGEGGGAPLIGDDAGGTAILGDLSVATFLEIASRPGAEVCLAARMRPRDPTTGRLRDLLVTSADRLHTEPGDDPPNAIHRSAVLKGWTTTRRLSGPGAFVGPSSVSVGTIVFDDSDGELAEWLDFEWSGAEVTLRVGGRTRADGTAYPYSGYYAYFLAVGDELRPLGNGQLELAVVGRRKELDNQVAGELYGGLGGCVAVPRGGRLWSATPIPATDVSATGAALQWLGTVQGLPEAGEDGVLFVATGFAGEDLLPWGLELRSDGALWVRDRGPGLVPTGWVVPLGARLYLALSVAPGGSAAQVWTATAGGAAELVAEVDLPVPVLDAGGNPEVGTFQGAGGAAVSPAEIRLWSRALSEGELTAGDGPVLDADAAEGLLQLWKFEDAEGSVARSELATGGLDLALEGGAAFAPTLEGDDPTSVDGGPLGQSKPDGWGRATNVRPVPVDTPHHVRQWSRRPSGDIERLYVGGAPMVPTESLTSTAGGQIVFDAASNSILFSGPLRGARFVAGQADPARTGQRLEVAGSASNDGTWTVAVDGVREGGRRVVLVEALAAETAGAGVTVRSLAADAQYTYDLERSTVSTPTDVGDLTADVALWLSRAGTARVSEVAAEILGEPVDATALQWDPEIGLWLAPGASIARRDALDRVVASACAWWVEDRRGGYRLGTWRLPSGDPKAVVDAGRIAKIEPVTTATPCTRFVVQHSWNWTVQDRSAVAGSVPASRRERVGKQFQTFPRTAPKSLRDRFPLAAARADPFVTYLTSDRDAKTFADLAQPLYMDKRRWFAVQASGLGLLVVDLDDCVWLQHPDPDLGLAAGALARILAMDEDTSTDLVTLEAFL